MPEFDGRFEIEIIYSVLISSVSLTHHHTFDVNVTSNPDPGADFVDIDATERSALIVPLATFMQDYMDVWSPLLGTGTTLEEIILWKYDPEPSQAKIYISSMSPLPTTSFASTSIAANGAIFTFRVAGYRYPMRMYIMEGVNSGESRVPSGALDGINAAYANFVTGTTSIIHGRSDAFPIATIALNLGQNEKLRNLRFR